MNFTKTDLYTSVGVIFGVIVARKYIQPIITSTLGA